MSYWLGWWGISQNLLHLHYSASAYNPGAIYGCYGSDTTCHIQTTGLFSLHWETRAVNSCLYFLLLLFLHVIYICIIVEKKTRDKRQET